METRILLPVVVLGLASGALGAGLVLFLQPPTESQTEVPETDGSGALEERIEALDRSVQQQVAELDALGGRVARLDMERVDLDAPTREEFEHLTGRLDAMGVVETLDGIPMPTDDSLQAAIDVALVQREEMARLEKEQRRVEREQKRIEKEVASWSKRLDMTPMQEVEMTALMQTRMEGRTEIRRAIEEGLMTKQDSGQPWRRLDEDYETGLTALLTPVQMETYQGTRGKR